MKTIDIERAQAIVYRLNLPKDSWLRDFEATGVIHTSKPSLYHAEIDEMLANPHRFIKKQLDELKQLKSYFNKYAQLPASVLRDPSKIKTLQFKNVIYAGEESKFMITWNELAITLIQPGQLSTNFSISLQDAKELAKEILKH